MQYTSIPNKKVLNTYGVFGHGDSMDRNQNYTPSSHKSVPTTEIDWCGAQLPNGGDSLGESTKVYTSDELLELLNGMSHKLQVLRQAIIDIGNKPEEPEDNGDEDGGDEGGGNEGGGSFSVNLIIINDTGSTIKSTGEIRLYVGDHIGINTYLPGASESAGALYNFTTGENPYDNIGCSVNGGGDPNDYRGQSVNEVRFYDYNHYQNSDAGYNAYLDTGDDRCFSKLKNSGTYIIRITN